MFGAPNEELNFFIRELVIAGSQINQFHVLEVVLAQQALYYRTVHHEGHLRNPVLGSNAVVSLEKRLFGRFRLRESETADLGFQASFRVDKISLNGMQVDSDTFVEPETVLDLEIRIGRHSFVTSGRVVHGTRLEPQPGVESASRLGIEFVDMDEETEKAIRKLIRDVIG